MKKALSILLVISICCCLCGCSSNDDFLLGHEWGESPAETEAIKTNLKGVNMLGYASIPTVTEGCSFGWRAKGYTETQRQFCG